MHFLALQFDIVWEDKAANHAQIETLLAASTVEDHSFILLPELGDTGFSMNLDRIVGPQSEEWAANLARRTRCYVQHGFARRSQEYEPSGRNCAAVFSPDGQPLGEYQKVHPFSYGKESQFYSGGDRLMLIKCGDALVCPMICYDLRFPELWRLAALNGAEIFTIGASWPAKRQHHWRSLLIARAIENQSYVVAVNRTGSDPHLQYVGGSMIIAPTGEVLAEAGDRPCTLRAKLNLEALREWRHEFPALRDIRRSLLGEIQIKSS